MDNSPTNNGTYVIKMSVYPRKGWSLPECVCRVSSLEFSYIPPHLAFHHYASPCAHYTSSVLVTAEQIIQQQQEKRSPDTREGSNTDV